MGEQPFIEQLRRELQQKRGGRTEKFCELGPTSLEQGRVLQAMAAISQNFLHLLKPGMTLCTSHMLVYGILPKTMI